VATTTTRLRTAAEHEKIPNPHGEPVKAPFPNQSRVRAQWQLRQSLQAAAGDAGRACTEFPYHPLPEHECWGADVAYERAARRQGIEHQLFGAPDLVAEVLSPSNTAAEIIEKRKLCLENGWIRFRIVNTDHRVVEVSTPDAHGIAYKSGQPIPLFFGGPIAVDEIFA
jgi:Putative restriction endonuclease